ncbi:hypothetical protein QBC47DRAFT_449552 [Echria macrotheca]|uniref:T6SS Phospholipase effector Tle1-like catalytic domain-containing protein n=1 Tax=Echria macrotheca TaxID=438768 RepID=A0AAJ0F876_9PEZI|nr:hypothetical protein QBC47DRAFT_449552 [Echria macrotheca]
MMPPSPLPSPGPPGSHSPPGSHPCPKRIIICCDGTWQSSVTNTVNVPSNVTRLARLLTKFGIDSATQTQYQQLVYYDAGIGTGVFKIEAALQGGTGSGFVGNVIEAYNFIVLNYNPGDQIFCIGFSRGAYTARAVAGLVTDIGVVAPRDMQDFPELYTLYQHHTDSHMFRQTKAWREWVDGEELFDVGQVIDKKKEKEEEGKKEDVAVLEQWVKGTATKWKKRPHPAPAESSRWVEAVAVFDTVGSLGVPEVDGIMGLVVKVAGKVFPVEKFGFHNVALSPYIKHAFHALALDEHRKPFSATMWHMPGDGVADLPKKAGTVEQLKKDLKELEDNPNAKDEDRDRLWGQLVAAQMHDELKGHKSELVQVWFPGVHINVGGGSDDLLKDKRGDFEQIAMITLHWMMARLEPYLQFVPLAPKVATEDRFLQMRPVVDELIASDNKSHWLMRKIQANIDDKTIPTPDLWKGEEDSQVTLKRVLAIDALTGWATGPIIDSYTGKMTLAGDKHRTPGEYKESQLQDGKVVSLGPTNEYVHPSVRYRLEHLKQENYNPVALWGFTPRKVTVTEKQSDGTLKEEQTYEWVKKDGTSIPEWKISARNWIERSCVASRSSRTWLDALDKELQIFSQPQNMVLNSK